MITGVVTDDRQALIRLTVLPGLSQSNTAKSEPLESLSLSRTTFPIFY
jgi:hypothetical protein